MIDAAIYADIKVKPVLVVDYLCALRKNCYEAVVGSHTCTISPKSATLKKTENHSRNDGLMQVV